MVRESWWYGFRYFDKQRPTWADRPHVFCGELRRFKTKQERDEFIKMHGEHICEPLTRLEALKVRYNGGIEGNIERWEIEDYERDIARARGSKSAVR
jgi:hypothetical protein